MKDEYFPFGEREISWLKNRDPQLGEVISKMGKPKRNLFPNIFSGLVFYIISQQISAKAAETEWKRFQELCSPVKLIKEDDAEFIKKITKLPGVGEWTAQMLLIHMLKRPNVISFKDVAVLREMCMVYRVSYIRREFFEQKKDIYSPIFDNRKHLFLDNFNPENRR